MSFEPLLNTIGQNIRNVRKNKAVKGETLAREVGVTKQAISNMENGLVDFKISTLHKIATALNTTSIVTLIENEQSIEARFEEYRFQSEKHLRTVDMLVARIEFLNEQIEYLRMEKASQQKLLLA